MPIALTITRDDYTAAGLREAVTRSNDADATRRMLALALVLEGYKRCEAGKLCGMDRQTLRDWVLRYNGEGIAGLCNRIAAGPKPRLTPQQEAAVAELLRKGPDLAVDGVVRWRRVDLARVIKTRFNVTLAERSVGAMLRRLGFRRLSVRPRHPQQDPAAQETQKKLRRSGQSRHPRACARKTDRTLVAGRSPGWSAGHIDPHLGRARQPTARPARSAPRMGLHIRRCLPASRYRRGFGAALCQCPGDEPASRGDQLPGDARQSRRLAPRWSRMAPDGRKAAGPRQYQSAPTAVLFSRIEPRREHLAVPAPEPSRQPRLQKLYRYR
jgi:transposase